jgi:hypothetical protein
MIIALGHGLGREVFSSWKLEKILLNDLLLADALNMAALTNFLNLGLIPVRFLISAVVLITLKWL